MLKKNAQERASLSEILQDTELRKALENPMGGKLAIPACIEQLHKGIKCSPQHVIAPLSVAMQLLATVGIVSPGQLQRKGSYHQLDTFLAENSILPNPLMTVFPFVGHWSDIYDKI